MIRSQPGANADAIYNRGNALQRAGEFADAVTHYDRALALRPDWVEALTNRGAALRALKRFDEAVASYDRALALRPTFVLALVNRGNVLRQLGRHHQSLASYEQALALQPDHPDILGARATALLDLGRLDEALETYTRVLAARPDDAGALYDRANVLQMARRYDEALADYNRALTLQPAFVDALNNRGNLLLSLRRNAEAARDFAALLKIAPDYPHAAGKLLHARMRCCDWADHEALKARILAGIGAEKRTAMPQELLAISDSPVLQLQCARMWVADKFPAVQSARPAKHSHDRIRIAYLSGDFRDHAVGYLIAGIVEHHDRARFDTIALSIGLPLPSETRARLERSFERFIDVHDRSDAEIVQLARELEIDILIDLNGHTGESRTGILARRAAPVQVNFLGYAGTMGADYADYIVADRIVIPEEHRPYFAEKVVWLPGTFFPAGSRLASDAGTNRSAHNLPGQGFVFCSFNNSYKITPDVFDVWTTLLKDVPGSVLWLSDPGQAARANLSREAEVRGVAPQRLIFAARTTSHADHLARLPLADLFLDTWPYNAHTTASDALRAGLPVLTKIGDAFAARVAASLLTALDMGELIAATPNAYRETALRLANDPAQRCALREKLTRNLKSGVFDLARYTRQLEAAYADMAASLP